MITEYKMYLRKNQSNIRNVNTPFYTLIRFFYSKTPIFKLLTEIQVMLISCKDTTSNIPHCHNDPKQKL